MIALLLALTFGAQNTDGSKTQDTFYRAAITAKPNPGTWRYVFSTKSHGEVDLDNLLDRIDSVLDGKMRDTSRRRKPKGAGDE
jgi:hypothetical protein